MKPETLKRLEELNEEWANEHLTPAAEIEIAREVMSDLPDLIAAVKERDQSDLEALTHAISADCGKGSNALTKCSLL
jgi:hypothetical protein